MRAFHQRGKQSSWSSQPNWLIVGLTIWLMNADTQQWLLCNTNPDVLSLMLPTIMAALNLSWVYSGLLAQSLHGTVTVAGNILLDLVKHDLLWFQLPTPFQLHTYPLLNLLLYIITFHAQHSICSFHHTVWFSHFRLLYSEKYLTGLKDCIAISQGLLLRHYYYIPFATGLLQMTLCFQIKKIILPNSWAWLKGPHTYGLSSAWSY